MVPNTRQASSFLAIFFFENSNLNPNQIQIQSNPFFALLSFSASRANLSCVVATIFTSFAFLSSSVSMTNLSRLVAASFSNLALLSSSVSTANLSCLLATTFSSHSFLSNSFSSPLFNLLRVAKRCFSWSSVSDDLFTFLLYFFGSPSCSICFASYCILSLSFLCSSVSEALFTLSFSFLSERFVVFSSMLKVMLFDMPFLTTS